MRLTFSFDGLLEEIRRHPIIAIYRHEHPDCDALGSQNALAVWLKTNFPDKQVYIMGRETTTQAPFPASDTVSDDIISQSLSIVLDTANQERVDDQRFANGQKVIKIDHHPDREPFGDLSFVFPKAAATCEILSEFFHQNRSEYRLTKEAVIYLYEGILTDTLCFRTSNTTAHSLEMAAYLAEYDIDIPGINRRLFDHSYKDYQFAGYIHNNVHFKEGEPAYIILKNDVLKKYGLTAPEARNFIDELGHVREFAIWAMFTQHDDGSDLYDGSLRSKTIVINDLAERYHGGGHPNACGVKNLDKASLTALLSDLSERI
jgi:acetate kinase/phosphoesterase RecJ-like protein